MQQFIDVIFHDSYEKIKEDDNLNKSEEMKQSIVKM